MIVVDTSALVAVALRQPSFDALLSILSNESRVIVSAGTLAEFLIVARSRGISVSEVEALLRDLGIEVVAVTEADSHRIGEAYGRWGKGYHPAGLNFGDCFAYVLARQLGCPLLYIGDDFPRTDTISAL